VIRFSIEDPRPAALCDRGEEPSLFLASEINTCIPEGLPGEGAFYSLLIETISGEQTVWIEILFSQVNVVPKEPLSFALIEADPRFEIPVYRLDEEK